MGAGFVQSQFLAVAFQKKVEINICCDLVRVLTNYILIHEWKNQRYSSFVRLPLNKFSGSLRMSKKKVDESVEERFEYML